MVVPVEVLVYVGKFPVNRGKQCCDRSRCNQGVQKWYGFIGGGNLCSDLYVWVNGVGVL